MGSANTVTEYIILPCKKTASKLTCMLCNHAFEALLDLREIAHYPFCNHCAVGADICCKGYSKPQKWCNFVKWGIWTCVEIGNVLR